MRRCGRCPIVLLTAKSEIQDIVEGLEAGGDDYLTKPFDQATLVARVRSLMRIKSLYETVAEPGWSSPSSTGV